MVIHFLAYWYKLVWVASIVQNRICYAVWQLNFNIFRALVLRRFNQRHKCSGERHAVQFQHSHHSHTNYERRQKKDVQKRMWYPDKLPLNLLWSVDNSSSMHMVKKVIISPCPLTVPFPSYGIIITQTKWASWNHDTIVQDSKAIVAWIGVTSITFVFRHSLKSYFLCELIQLALLARNNTLRYSPVSARPFLLIAFRSFMTHRIFVS